MADKNAKNPKNVAGSYYVDNSCISCGQCASLAPDCFKEDADGGTFYVCQQPAAADAVQMCRDALNGCPVEAIGDDG